MGDSGLVRVFRVALSPQEATTLGVPALFQLCPQAQGSGLVSAVGGKKGGPASPHLLGLASGKSPRFQQWRSSEGIELVKGPIAQPCGSHWVTATPAVLGSPWLSGREQGRHVHCLLLQGWSSLEPPLSLGQGLISPPCPRTVAVSYAALSV